jgi:hypothetical protein
VSFQAVAARPRILRGGRFWIEFTRIQYIRLGTPVYSTNLLDLEIQPHRRATCNSAAALSRSLPIPEAKHTVVIDPYFFSRPLPFLRFMVPPYHYSSRECRLFASGYTVAAPSLAKE